MNLKILHLIPHLGGGVGSVISAWMQKTPARESHSIICFDKNKNEDWRALISLGNITVVDHASALDNFAALVAESIRSADIVILHWWNHPQIFDLLVNFQWPQCRLVIWNHVSGLFPPYVLTSETINFCDFFVNTSPVSLKNAAFEKAKTNFETIWSTVDITNFSDLPRPCHDNFLVGYTGTVDVGKLHNDFIQISSPAIKDDLHFIVCSGDSQDRLKSEAALYGVSDSFSFMGRVPSVLPYLSQYDVMGYPLQAAHFGTCEQSLGEAMMAGCVPVVLNNPSESFIVEHERSGLVAQTTEQYSECLLRLYYDKGLLRNLSLNAKKRAKDLYDIHRTLDKWKELFDKILYLPKRKRSYAGHTHCTPAELYALSLGKYATPFMTNINAKNPFEIMHSEEDIKELFSTNPMFYSNNKGSVLQYLQFFPNDKTLATWAKLLA